jgi:hypothetical protein
MEGQVYPAAEYYARVFFRPDLRRSIVIGVWSPLRVA